MAFSSESIEKIKKRYGLEPEMVSDLKVFRTSSTNETHKTLDYLVGTEFNVPIMASPGLGFYEVVYNQPPNGEEETPFSLADADNVYTEFTGEY